MNREAYRSDVSDEEWAFTAVDLSLMRADARQRAYEMREVCSGCRWIIRTGAQWRMMPNDLPPWRVVYQQSQRWVRAGVFEAMANDLRRVLRLAEGRDAQPTIRINSFTSR